MFQRFGWFGFVLGVLFWVVLIGLIRRNRNRKTAAFLQHRPNSPLEIAMIRYANGEITKEQFDQLNNDLK